MATVLITRPEAEAQRTAEKLRAEGRETIVSPVLMIREDSAPLPAGDFAAVAVPSGNATAWLGRDEVRAALAERLVFAVGDQTADAIKNAGYGHVQSAHGSAQELVALIARALPPPARLLIPVGRHHGEEWLAELRSRGYEAVPVVVYEAAQAEQLSAEAVAGLRYDVIDAVLHYSSRSARAFIDLAERAQARDKLARVKHICLSPTILESLPEDLKQSSIAAGEPNEAALFAALASALGDSASESADDDSSPARPRRSARARPPRVIDGEAHVVAESLRDGSPSDTADSAAAVSHDATAADASGHTTEAAALEAPREPRHGDARADGDINSQKRNAAFDAPSAHSGAAAPEREQTMRSPSFADAPASETRSRPSLLAPLLVSAIAGAAAGAGVLFFASSLSSSSGVMDALNARLSGLAARSDLTAAQQKIDGLAAALAREQAAMKAELATLAQRIASAGASADDPDARRSAAANAQAIQQAAQRLQALEQQVTTLARAAAQPPVPSATTNAVRRHALASALAQSLARGGAYEAELDALKSLGAPSAQIAALEPYARGGAPSARALSDEFKPIAPKLLDALQSETPSNSLLDRAVGALKQMVRIRPIGEARGDDPATLVARIEDALSRGSLSQAVASFDRLPERLRAIGADWRARVQARIDAGAAAQAALDDATRALSAPSN
ncbi:MAG: uroporphyrinogen-III synthase [Rhizobiales bacterium]|nr:uroporphyrinogen-III synthase [Hyphomicrobiales bacterium]